MMHPFEEEISEAAFKKLSPDRLEKVASNVRSFIIDIENDPALLKEAQDKLGFDWREFLGRAATVFGLGAAGTVGAVGANALISKARTFVDSLGKAKAYKSMLDHNPQLSEEGVDAKAVQLHFNTLYKFNPDYAKDPLVAGAYIQNAVEMARPNLETINNIVNARKNIVESSGRGVDVKGVAGVATKLEGIAQDLNQEEYQRGWADHTQQMEHQYPHIFGGKGP